MPEQELPEWAQAHFPIKGDEQASSNWKPLILKNALAMRVLCVATTRIEGLWCAYCDAVPGNDHEQEQGKVLQVGDKLPENIALALFPSFIGVPYAD